MNDPALWGAIAAMLTSLTTLVKLFVNDTMVRQHGQQLTAIKHQTNDTLDKLQLGLAAAQAVAATAEELAARRAASTPPETK